jgi:hypothetical protein
MLINNLITLEILNLIISFKKIIVYFKDYLYFIFFPSDFKKFVKNNKLISDAYFVNNLKKKKIIVNLLYKNTRYQLMNLVIANYVKSITGLKTEALVNKFDFYSIKLAQSFNIDTFIYDKNKTFFERLKIYNLSYKLFKKKESNNILKYTYEKISIGKIIYDHCIKIFNMGTIKNFGTEHFKFFVSAFENNMLAKKVFSSKEYKFFIQSEKHWIPANLLFQNSLKYKTKIICRLGDEKNISVRLYNNFSKNFLNKAKINDKTFKFFYNNISLKKNILSINKANLSKRFFNNLKIKSNLEKKIFCRNLNLNYKNPIVCIYANNLTDGIFSNEWSIFKDNFTWLIETVNYIKNINDVSWIIKGHPLEIKNNDILSTEDALGDKIKNFTNIKFLKDTDRNAKKIHNVIDLGVSAHGSIAVELPAIGIPCVIAGDAFCSKKGFTIEPKSKNEYFRILDKIRLVRRLKKDAILRANIFYNIYNNKIRDKINFLENSSKHANKIYSNLLKKKILIKKYNKTSFYKSLKFQLEKNNRHLISLKYL